MIYATTRNSISPPSFKLYLCWTLKHCSLLWKTEGPDDGLNSTEVVITDLGHLGDEAIVVLEEAVGVGAEETVNGGPVVGNGLVSIDDGTSPFFHSNTGKTISYLHETNLIY